MEIIGGKITKTMAQKMVDNVTQASLNLNLIVQEVSLKGKQVIVRYFYEVDYKEKQAKMEMHGEVFLTGTDKEMKEFEEKWRKTKQIDPLIAEQILNSVTYSGMAVGTLLAFSVGMPAPLTMQKFKVDVKQSAS